MSNKKKMQRKIGKRRDLLDALVGQVFDGGCDDCNAYMEVSADDEIGGHRLVVNHDATCPFYASLAAGGRR